MKRCPTCNKSYTDPNLSFCIDDGTPLVKADAAASYDSEATLVSPSPSGGGAPSDWKGPVYQPPGQVGPAPTAPNRRVWPWVVGILALLFLVLIGFGVVAAIYLPNMMRAARDTNENRSSFNVNTARNENANRNSNANENANANANRSANANANSEGSPPPTDQNEVLSDLKDLEDEWTAANVNADKKKLARILADDYVSTLPDGSMHGKAEYLKVIKRDPTIKHWDFDNLELTLKGDRATLKGTVHLQRDGEGEDETLRFTDKFVWRDGRWQAVGSEVSPVE
jgi:ketosteroid isomerase-like protein